MASHICWLGLKYVTSQRTFCGSYVGILTSSLKEGGKNDIVEITSQTHILQTSTGGHIGDQMTISQNVFDKYILNTAGMLVFRYFFSLQ